MSLCRDKAKKRLPKSSAPRRRRFAGRLRRLHRAACGRHDPRRIRRVRCAPIDKFRAHDYGLIPVERYFALKGKRQLDYISSQGCNFRCAFCSDPFVYGRKWVGLDPDANGDATGGAVGALPFRRRQFPGRDVLHAPRSRRGDGRPDHRVRHEDHLGGDHARRPGRASAGGRLERFASSPGCADFWSAWNPAPTRC